MLALLLGGALFGAGSLAASPPETDLSALSSSGSLLPPGVTREVDDAIERGLRYLLSNRQTFQGHRVWGWGKTTRGWAEDTYHCAMTALVGQVLLAHGSTPTRGPHAAVVREITDFLLASSTTNGLITSGWDEERPMYSHAFAMVFLGMVYGQEREPARRERIRDALQKAIGLTARAQTNDGGWGYSPDYYSDEGTLTVTQLQGLRVCRDAGLLVPKSLIDGAVDYIKKSSDASGRVRYRPNSGQWRQGVTCAAVVALWNAGEFDTPIFKRTRDFVNADIAGESGWLDFRNWNYTHHGEFVAYYLALSQWVQGEALWARFYPRAAAGLLQLQEPAGSWHGRDDGDIYSTAIALLILGLPYNRLPVYQR
jgi:hypothetical protein